MSVTRLAVERRLVRVTVPPTPGVTIKIERVGPRGPQGPIGPEGPDPWMAAVQDVAGQGVVNLIYTAGKHIRLSLLGNISQLNVTGWPIASRCTRI